MKESFLYFIWRHQYFEKTDLKSISKDRVNIIFPGFQNQNSGPDFSEAKIVVGDLHWAGNVEIHVKSSDWLAHNHQNDKAYDNVVLHVVWEHDKPIFRTDGSEIPTIELKNRVDPQLVNRSNTLISKKANVSCANDINNIEPLNKLSMANRVLMERLERKALEVLQIYNAANNDWEQCAYVLLCKNLGFKNNAQPFEQLGRVLPIKILRKQSDSQFQLEALLFGQAGFLDNLQSEYQQELEFEYRFLEHKYQLKSGKLKKEQWKFGRLRPANFPTIRLAQLSAIVKNTTNLFSSLVEIRNYKEIESLLKIDLPKYWKTHYRFNEDSNTEVASIGKTSIENIVINTIVPLLVAYGKSIDNQRYVDKAVEFLESITPENNKIIRIWNEIGEKATNSFDTQAQIELYNNYCSKKNCLKCEIGVQILKPANQ